VVGLGRFGGGVGVTRWLVDQGARVTVTDLAEPEKLGASLDRIADLDVSLKLGGHDPDSLRDADMVVVNPAVPKQRSAFFRQITESGIPWTTEMNLFCERCPATVIGITGTYGKSTTCVMLDNAVRASVDAGRTGFTAVHLGGNIGRSLLGRLEDIKPTDLVILEMSNAQLEDLPRIHWAPPFAVVANAFPNHLDRHGSWEAYVEAKLNILRDPVQASRIVLGPVGRDVEAMVERIVPSASGRVHRVTPADPPVELAVAGRHNRANADCVLAVGRLLGLDEAITRRALRSFTGLPHRLEHVRSLAGVDYINDSKSTSPAAIQTAIESLGQPIVAIIGGVDKGVCFADCAAALATRCRAVICVGESGPAFARALRAVEAGDSAPTLLETDGLPEAVCLAREQAQAGDAVLFAPGAPSFDAYPNFEERGRHFIELVNAL
jgi:UDP-N-acetylmuramoylalanine--D-glutamate ligase